MEQLELLMPDDWHVHLRQGSKLKDTVPATAKAFHRALIMPNLTPPLISVAAINEYLEAIMAYCSNDFQPYFSLYMHEEMTQPMLNEAANTPHILGVKLYPQGATTNSDFGISSIDKQFHLFEAMEKQGLTLQVHAETTTDDIFYREQAFLEQVLSKIHNTFDALNIVVEHISTKAACDFVIEAGPTVAATITPQHLLFNRNDLLSGGIKPHLYCLPILKSEPNQKAVQQAALSGNPKFFLGTDSAPHGIEDKQSACGCAGIFSAPYAMPLYIEFFEANHALDKLQAFSSQYGANFYKLPQTTKTVTYCKSNQTVPNTLQFGDALVQPICAGKTLSWQQQENTH